MNGTILPTPLLLMAKIMVLVLAMRGYAYLVMPRRGVSFIPILEQIGGDSDWRLGLSVLFFTGGTLVMFNFKVRLGCVLSGLALILATLINAGGFANSRFYPGCILLLTGLWDGGPWTMLALRAQVVVLYFGATVNKLLDVDWLNGRYFEFWIREKLQINWYSHAAEALPAGLLSTTMGITTIVLEFLILFTLLYRDWRPFAFAGACAFHIIVFVITGLDFGVFLYVSLCSFLVFAPPDAFDILSPGAGDGGYIKVSARRIVGKPVFWLMVIPILSWMNNDELQIMGKIITTMAGALLIYLVFSSRHATRAAGHTLNINQA